MTNKELNKVLEAIKYVANENERDEITQIILKAGVANTNNAMSKNKLPINSLLKYISIHTPLPPKAVLKNRSTYSRAYQSASLTPSQ